MNTRPRVGPLDQPGTVELVGARRAPYIGSPSRDNAARTAMPARPRLTEAAVRSNPSQVVRHPVTQRTHRGDAVAPAAGRQYMRPLRVQPRDPTAYRLTLGYRRHRGPAASARASSSTLLVSARACVRSRCASAMTAAVATSVRAANSRASRLRSTARW